MLARTILTTRKVAPGIIEKRKGRSYRKRIRDAERAWLSDRSEQNRAAFEAVLRERWPDARIAPRTELE